jgi:lysophospholipase L1-like esterase
MGSDAVKPFFPVDHTHTDKAGAQLNAEIVMEELKKLGYKGIRRTLR